MQALKTIARRYVLTDFVHFRDPAIRYSIVVIRIHADSLIGISCCIPNGNGFSGQVGFERVRRYS
jgi:hypothetical protein